MQQLAEHLAYALAWSTLAVVGIGGLVANLWLIFALMRM